MLDSGGRSRVVSIASIDELAGVLGIGVPRKVLLDEELAGLIFSLCFLE